MAGEMSQADVTREEFPEYFAAADLIGGEVRAFDVYQGPYIRGPKGKYWLCQTEGGSFGYWYNERDESESERVLNGDAEALQEAFQAFAAELQA